MLCKFIYNSQFHILKPINGNGVLCKYITLEDITKCSWKFKTEIDNEYAAHSTYYTDMFRGDYSKMATTLLQPYHFAWHQKITINIILIIINIFIKIASKSVFFLFGGLLW